MNEVDIQTVLAQAITSLPVHHDNPRLEAEILLAHSLDKDRSYLFSWPEKTLTTSELKLFLRLLKRRVLGIPIAYLTAKREFWSLPLTVSQDVLIPRIETESLVTAALNIIPHSRKQNILDLGTGSGAIALAIASERPQAQIVAVDCSQAALNIARNNAAHLKLDNIDFLHSDWYHSLKPAHFNLIVSNPPYVPEDDPHLQRGDVRFEPALAVCAGNDGLQHIRHIIEAAPNFLTDKSGFFVLEHGYDQADRVASLLQKHGFKEICQYKDYAGQYRVSSGQLTNTPGHNNQQ